MAFKISLSNDHWFLFPDWVGCQGGLSVAPPIQKCVFRSVQLLTRGYLKELTRIKRKVLDNYIKERKWLRRKTLELEKGKINKIPNTLKFSDTKEALSIYKKLQSLYSDCTPTEIQNKVTKFFSTSVFRKWNGHPFFLERYQKIFNQRQLNYTKKGLKYIVPKVYKPINMESFHSKKLRKCLTTFHWLRNYHKILGFVRK